VLIQSKKNKKDFLILRLSLDHQIYPDTMHGASYIE
jgi:hypothetical protein